MKNHSNNQAQRMGGVNSKRNPFNVVKVAFSPKAFEQIKKTIGSRPAESGGALFGNPENLKSPIPYITDFVFDNGANATRVTYSINTKFLNPVIHDKWDNHGLELHGIIHSHPGGCSRPSSPDMEYFHNMHTYMERPFLITPIIFTEPDGGFKMFCYLVGPGTPAIEAEYCIMDEKEYEKAIAELGTCEQNGPGTTQQETDVTGNAKASEELTEKNIEEDNGINDANEVGGIEHDHETEGIIYEKFLMNQSKVLIISDDGLAWSVACMLAHHGVGEIIAFDPSFTQKNGSLDLATKTVLALGEQIKEINPYVKYTPYGNIRFISKEQEKSIVSHASLAIVMTNSIYITAYGAKISKQYNIPTIWAVPYNPITSELIFSIPNEMAFCCSYMNGQSESGNNEENTGSTTKRYSLNSLIIELALAVIQEKISAKDYKEWFGSKLEQKSLRTQVINLSHSTSLSRTKENAKDVSGIDKSSETEAKSTENFGQSNVTLAPGTLNADVNEVMGIDYCCEADAVDIGKLKQSKIVIVGSGGMYEGASMFPRAGIGEIIAIDPDTVEPRNICRQGYLPRQNGMYKVDALGEHIKEINPDVKYKGYPVKLQDLTPEQEKEIFSSASVVIFTTDSFDAQAYGNIIALRYKIPAIWGGFYEKSLASEIVFYIPDVTPACFRCAVSPRYKFQEDYKANNNGKELSISSACNTIFHSALLDAQIGMLTMAIIHNKVEGKTFSGWFGDYFDRTLIQMNVNPLYQSRLFDRVFAESGDSAFLFESVWQHIEPERPPKYALCPDCHGGVNQESAHTENEEASEENKD